MSGERPALPGTLVVVPTFNEAATIETLIDAVLAAAREVEVLVVDDGSPDGTAEIVAGRASRRIHLLRRSAKQGLGRAYRAGFAWGLQRGYQRFVEIDADLSHDPAAVPLLLEATQTCDLAIGSRYVGGGGVEGWSRRRLLLSRAGNVYARALLGFPVRDSTSGFRCYRAEVLEGIGIEQVRSEGYAFQIDMTYRAWRLGYVIREVPITFRERAGGRSKLSRAIVAEAISSVTFWGLRDLPRRGVRWSARAARR